MSQPRSERSQPPADAIPDFGDLYPRPTGINTMRVLSLSGDQPTSYTVDLREGTCSCEDDAYHRNGGECCKHLAAALYQAPDVQDIDDNAVRSLGEDIQAVENQIGDLAQKLTAIEANGHTVTETTDTDSTEEDGGEFSDDPVERFEALLRDAGLDPDDFTLWVDDQRGSLQIDQDGYLESGEFDTWVDMSDDIDLGYDGDEDVNFLTPDRFPEVLG